MSSLIVASTSRFCEKSDRARGTARKVRSRAGRRALTHGPRETEALLHDQGQQQRAQQEQQEARDVAVVDLRTHAGPQRQGSLARSRQSAPRTRGAAGATCSACPQPSCLYTVGAWVRWPSSQPSARRVAPTARGARREWHSGTVTRQQQKRAGAASQPARESRVAWSRLSAPCERRDRSRP